MFKISKEMIKKKVRKYFPYFVAFLLGVMACGIATYARGEEPALESFVEYVAQQDNMVWHSMMTPYGPAYVYGDEKGEKFVAMIVYCQSHEGWHIAWITDDGLLIVDDYVAKTEAEAKEFVESRGLF